MGERIEAAREAVAVLGGPTQAAAKLSEYLGRDITRMTVQNWLRYGVSRGYIAAVEALADIPCHRLDPDFHPQAVEN